MITIPKQFYVGRKDQGKTNPIPLAFLVPSGTDKAFEKRKQTVDSWVEGYYYNEKNKVKLEPLTLDNTPTKGFEIAKEVRRHGWNGGNVVWRMVDPRGFEFEISSANLARILDCCTITNGAIDDACVYGRDGARNVLLPISSEPYQIAFTNTARAAKKLNTKDIKVGDRIVLKDGTTGIYVGQKKVVCYSSKETYNSQYNVRGYEVSVKAVDLKPRHLVLTTVVRDTANEREWDQLPWCSRLGRRLKEGEIMLTAFSDLHVSEIVESNARFDAKKVQVSKLEDMSEAYAIVDYKTKITDLKIDFHSMSFENWVAFDKEHYNRPIPFILVGTTPMMCRPTTRYVGPKGTEVLFFEVIKLPINITSVDILSNTLLKEKLEYLWNIETSANLRSVEEMKKEQLLIPYLQFNDGTEIAIGRG